MLDIESAMDNCKWSEVCECGYELSFTYSQAKRGGLFTCPKCGKEIRLQLKNPEEVDKVQADVNNAVKGLENTIKDINRRNRI